jgi:hypothetical protein
MGRNRGKEIRRDRVGEAQSVIDTVQIREKRERELKLVLS